MRGLLRHSLPMRSSVLVLAPIRIGHHVKAGLSFTHVRVSTSRLGRTLIWDWGHREVAENISDFTLYLLVIRDGTIHLNTQSHIRLFIYIYIFVSLYPKPLVIHGSCAAYMCPPPSPSLSRQSLPLSARPLLANYQRSVYPHVRSADVYWWFAPFAAFWGPSLYMARVLFYGKLTVS